jgi:hypothetical protein
VGSDWKSITKEEFDDFRIDPTYLAQRRNLPTTFGISSISATPSAIPKLSPPTSDVAVVLDPSFVYKTTRLTANRRSANDYQDDFDDRKQDWSLQPDDIFDTHPIAYQTETRVLSHDRSPQNIFDFARFTDRKTNGNLGDGEIKSVPQNIFDFARFTDRKSNGNLGDGEIMSVHVGLCGPGNQPPPPAEHPPTHTTSISVAMFKRPDNGADVVVTLFAQYFHGHPSCDFSDVWYNGVVPSDTSEQRPFRHAMCVQTPTYTFSGTGDCKREDYHIEPGEAKAICVCSCSAASELHTSVQCNNTESSLISDYSAAIPFKLPPFFDEVSGYVSDFIPTGLWSFGSGKDGWTYPVVLEGVFVQTAGTLLQHTEKNFHGHRILTFEVNRQLTNTTDSDLNVWTNNAYVITFGPLGLENALEFSGEHFGRIRNYGYIEYSTSHGQFQWPFLLWHGIAISRHLLDHPYQQTTTPLLWEIYTLTPQKLGYDKASIHFGWIFAVTITNISPYYRNSGNNQYVDTEESSFNDSQAIDYWVIKCNVFAWMNVFVWMNTKVLGTYPKFSNRFISVMGRSVFFRESSRKLVFDHGRFVSGRRPALLRSNAIRNREQMCIRTFQIFL